MKKVLFSLMISVAPLLSHADACRGACNYIGADGDPYRIRGCQSIFNDRQCGYVPGCEWDSSCE